MTAPVAGRRPRRARQEFVYFLAAQWTGFGSGIECVNARNILVNPNHVFARLPFDIPRDGFPEMSGLPLLQYKGKAQKYHYDFEILSGIWVLSLPLRAFFEDIDPGALAFRECQTQNPDGSPAPPRSLAIVTRHVTALDRERSDCKPNMYDPTGWYVSLSISDEQYFWKSAIGSHHIFRMAEDPAEIVTSQRVKDTFKERGWRGARFCKAFLV